MGKLKKLIEKLIIVLTEPKDWKKERNGGKSVFKGNYLVYDRFGRIQRRVLGQIVQWRGLPTEVYIYNPPAFVKSHRHAACFQLLKPNDRWFRLHFDKPAKDFESASTYVEHLLTEAYELENEK